MIQAPKDGNNSSKEPKINEPSNISIQRPVQAIRTVHAVDPRRTTFIPSSLGGSTAVILSDGDTFADNSTLQFRRVSLGSQVQHVVTPVQGISEAQAASARCSAVTSQDLTHILVAATTTATLQAAELPASVVTVSASMSQQQLQTLGNITNVVTGGQRTAGTAVIAQPLTQTTVAPRIVLNSGGMSDMYALRITPSTLAGGVPSQQIMVLDTSTNLASSSDVTKVHSYSLASASVPHMSAMQKFVISTAGQPLQVAGLQHKTPITHSQLRVGVKRQLLATGPARLPVVSVNNSDVLCNLSVINKLLFSLVPSEGRLPIIPSSPKSKRIKLDKSAFTNRDPGKRRRLVEHLSKKLLQLKIKYYQQQSEYFFLKNGGNLVDYILWRKKALPALLDYLKANRFEPQDDVKTIAEILSQSTFQSIGNPTLLSQGVKDEPVPKSHSSSSRSPSSFRSSGSPSSNQRVVSTGIMNVMSKNVRQSLSPHKHSPKQSSISTIYDSQIGGSQEEIVERAKQEAYVMQRVSDLRKEGLWSLKRLPKVSEAPRIKAHYDYLLEEMAWLATDFAQERKWKKAAAKKCARMITKYFQEKEIKAERAEKDEQIRMRKIASSIAREIKQFWNNIEKLAEFKQQTWLEEKRKHVLDVHLNFIVDQTEKYSSWLTQGMNQPTKDSPESSRASTPSLHSHKVHDGSDSFEAQSSDADDEETIEKEEASVNKVEQDEEIKLLQQESEMSMEDFLDSLPPEVLSSFGDSRKEDSSCEEAEEADDEEFEVSADEEDDEQTLLEQEKEEANVDHDEEMRDLEAENEMTVEQLREKYSAAYASDFEMEELSSHQDDSDASSSNEALSDEEDTKDGDGFPKNEDENPTQDITNIAAEAESFQPKGNTLSTTQVCTKVPFLLKHQLREYQHIGLDWLNAMCEKNLNGILADEMGLGKTIQTISVLAHLACEKGIWGPHLIVVPTSVMLNWEMEFKKWCPAFKILTYYGTPKERKLKRVGWTKPNAFHVCITSYKLVVQDHQSFRRKKWKYLILDEAHHIKNFKSQRWQMLLNFQSSHRLLLTGTPLQNHLTELWSLMHFLMPNVFHSHREFKEWFGNPLSGIIEGNHEYDEGLIKRLHKVLRPFLLRRLKCEVEKQLPKKYEHVIMCRLSNRQRYLYDDFMGQTKTKETLATGNFMSVINILMQLRKVCNHPNMFEERPTVSPFLMEGIRYDTASLVKKALEYDPFKHVSLLSLNLLLADLELSLTAFAAHRVKKFQVPPKLIVEIDNLPEPPPPCPAVKMKVNFCNSQSTSSPAAAPPRFPVAVSRPPSNLANPLNLPGVGPQTPRYMVIPRSVNPANAGGGQVVQADQYTLQLIQSGSAGGLPLTLQPGAQKCIQSLFGNVGRVIQIAAGPHFVVSSVGNSVGESLPTATTLSVAQPKIPNAQLVLSTSSIVPKIGPALTNSVRPATSLTTPSQPPSNQLPGRLASLNGHTPFSQPEESVVNQNHVQQSKNAIVHSLSKPAVPKLPVADVKPVDQKKDSLFYLESLSEKQTCERKDTLRTLAKINNRRCSACPIYGTDLVEAVTIINSLSHPRGGSSWKGRGYVNCLNAKTCTQKPKLYWDHTSALSEIIKTPEDYVVELKEIVNRFVFVVPAVTAPPLELHVSHPSPSQLNAEHAAVERLSDYLAPKCAFLHPIVNNMRTQFPELRLIEYDCGKLQTLAKLLYDLKKNHNRVLIFTQMTRMLDILEQFLNYHGHTYLRLDGNTKVEQRQALMERFNADKRIFCFILSTRSGGIGVNLTGADTVVFYDSDWNPTMDAQAQDRCHRIGQTRDVHIYRLISERTIEENILKKANQKRMLGDLAIEGGNFTTAFFKTNTINDLFGIEVRSTPKIVEVEKIVEVPEKPDKAGEFSQSELEKALGMAEEESDLQAAQTASAEAVAEFAEFDESIPLECDSRDNEEKSASQKEFDHLMSQLSAVEKYALNFVESMQEPVSLEQLKLAEEEIEAQKKNWELGHLKALKQEEERRSKQLNEEDSPLFCGQEASNQVYFSVNGQEEMPIWAPPTPPSNENDIYIDHTVSFWYEPSFMHEARLPPVYIKKEAKRLKIDPIISASVISRKQKVRKDDMVTIPKSLFDRPSAAILKMRREVKLQKVKGLMIGGCSIPKPLPTFPGLKQPPLLMNKPMPEMHQEKPEWLVQEDYCLLQVMQEMHGIPLTLTILLPGHTPNWDLASEAAFNSTKCYRSPKSCKLHYENVIVPREEGKILYDTNPKKQKKTKGIYKTKNNRPMKTSQLFLQDNNAAVTRLSHDRFKYLTSFPPKRRETDRAPLSVPPKNKVQPSVLADNNIVYDNPLMPQQIAAIRADRIARDKMKNQQPGTVVLTPVLQAAPCNQIAPAQVQSTEPQRSVAQPASVTVSGATSLNSQQAQAVIASLAQAQQLQQVQLSKANLPAGSVSSVSFSKSLPSGIMVNTVAGSTSAGTLASLTKALGQAGVTSISTQDAQNAAIAAALSNAGIRNQRAGATTAMSVQEIVAAAVNQARPSTTVVGTASPAVMSVSNLTAVQLAASQRLAGTTMSPATTVISTSGTQLNQLPTTAAQRNLPQPTYNVQTIRHSALMRHRQQHLKRLQTVQQQQAAAAQSSAAKVSIGPAGTLTVAAQQRLTQQVAMKQSVGRPLGEAEMTQLMKRQQQKQAQLASGQLLTQVQPQQVSISGGTATLVKTVSAPLSGTSSLAIPVSAVTMGGMNINVNVPQGKAGKGGATTITNQQLRQFQLQQQILSQARKGNKMAANLTQLAKVPTKGTGLATSALTASMNTVQIVQHNPQVGGTQQVKALPTAMTVQQIQQAMKQAIPQNLPVVVTATPSIPSIPQQSVSLRGEPNVAGSVKAQTTTLPSTTLTTSGMLKGAPAVVMGQQQTATLLQQMGASTPQAVTLAVRAATAQGSHQVQIQVQPPQVMSPATQTSQARIQQLTQNTAVSSMAQPVTVQASSLLSPTATLVQQVSMDTTMQTPTHVVMHNVGTSSAATTLTLPASLATSQSVSTTAQVVQAAIQVAKQQQLAAQQAAQAAAAQQQKASPYTMRLRNPPK